MNIEKLTSRYNTVCHSPSVNGFHIDHLSDLLQTSDIDDSAPHVHSFYEILWFQCGEGVHTVDFQEYTVRPGTIFFLSPGQVHHFDQQKDYTGVAIKMCTDFMKDEEGQNSLFLKYNAFFNASPYFYIDASMSAALSHLVQEMETEAACTGAFGNIEVLKSLLRIFIVKIQRHSVQEDKPQLDDLKPQHRLFIQFRRLVEQEYKHLHTVQEYADRLNVAVRTLNKTVNECSQKSPLTYINDRIMLEAKRMVRYSNMMFKEIAFDLGFEDPSYFVKLFKRHTGYLPSDFREMEDVIHCRLDRNNSVTSDK